MSDGYGSEQFPRWRRAIVRWITGVDIDEHVAGLRSAAPAAAATREWMRGVEEHLAALQADHERLDVRVGTLTNTSAHIVDWISGAERHLAALQVEQTDQSRFEQRVSEARARDLAPVLAWIRAAEGHLAALQKDHERVFERIYPDRLALDVALLEARLSDCERAHTAIAAATATVRTGDDRSPRNS
jgi:hypothetical protein